MQPHIPEVIGVAMTYTESSSSAKISRPVRRGSSLVHDKQLFRSLNRLFMRPRLFQTTPSSLLQINITGYEADVLQKACPI